MNRTSSAPMLAAVLVLCSWSCDDVLLDPFQSDPSEGHARSEPSVLQFDATAIPGPDSGSLVKREVSLAVRDETLCVGGGSILLCRYALGGEWTDHSGSWASNSGFEIGGLWLQTADDVVAVGGGAVDGQSRVVRLSDRGAGVAEYSVGPGTLHAVHGRSTQDAVAIGTSPTKREPAGAAFATVDPEGTGWLGLGTLADHPPLHDVHVRADGSRVAVGDGGTALYSADGEGWQLESTGGTGHALRAVWARDGGPFYAVGDANTMLIRTSAGWKNAPSATPQAADWLAMDGASEGVVFAVGRRHVARLQGDTWLPIALEGLSTELEFHAIAVQDITSPPTVWLAGDTLASCLYTAPPAEPRLGCIAW